MTTCRVRSTSISIARMGEAPNRCQGKFTPEKEKASRNQVSTQMSTWTDILNMNYWSSASTPCSNQGGRQDPHDDTVDTDGSRGSTSHSMIRILCSFPCRNVSFCQICFGGHHVPNHGRIKTRLGLVLETTLRAGNISNTEDPAIVEYLAWCSQ
ncbi:hypothetical protein BDV59DRAFT_181623 [Aspergillus ambiguus]|uniref:uncharacterized protein n=1 Tax=Aspergillus ambiguus TaxID=176160 RepID=UPI003CCCD7A1